MADLGIALAFMVAAALFVGVNLAIGGLLRPRNPTDAKGQIYECGEVPIGTAWIPFNPRFYVVALVFLIFEVEIALMFPVASLFSEAIARGTGMLAFAEIAAFLALLGVGLFYVWKRGDLRWDQSGESLP